LLDHLIHLGFPRTFRWSRSAAISACAAASSISTRQGYGRPIRLEFDNDRLESIREFNPANQRTETVQEEFIFCR
jgi:transcription-repair coupling factor (superfamily II helicase)